MKRGFTIIEVIVYIAILAIIIMTLFSTMTVITKLYRQVVVNRSLESSALLALDRMAGTIRSSDSVNVGQSVLDSSPGSLTLNAHRSSGVAYTALFSVQNGVLKLTEDSVSQGQLTSSSTSVTNLVFRYIDGSISKAVKIEMTLVASSSGYTKTETFYTTAILKNSY